METDFFTRTLLQGRCSSLKGSGRPWMLPLGLILLLFTTFQTGVSAMKDQPFKTSDALRTDPLTEGNTSVVTKSKGDRSFHSLLWVLSDPKWVAPTVSSRSTLGSRVSALPAEWGLGRLGRAPAPGSLLPASAVGAGSDGQAHDLESRPEEDVEGVLPGPRAPGVDTRHTPAFYSDLNASDVGLIGRR